MSDPCDPLTDDQRDLVPRTSYYYIIQLRFHYRHHDYDRNECTLAKLGQWVKCFDS